MDIKALRYRLGYQGRGGLGNFADDLGISASTVRKWENGTRKPDSAALTLLHLVGWLSSLEIDTESNVTAFDLWKIEAERRRDRGTDND